MRILVDAQALQNNSRDRGIGRYAKDFLKALVENRGDHEIYILLNGLFKDGLEPLKNELENYIDKSHILVFNAIGPIEELRPQFQWNLHVSELLRETFITELNPDAVINTTLFEGALDDTVVSIGRLSGEILTATILYDLIPLTDADKYLGSDATVNWYMRRLESFKRSDLLLAISESARQEAISLIKSAPDQVKTIYAGISKDFLAPVQGSSNVKKAIAKFGITKDYIMHMGAYEARKNFKSLIEAYALLPEDLQARYDLVLTFRKTHNNEAEVASLLSELNIPSSRVILTGYVRDDMLVKLYKGASLFVFPSLHEGFGLPPLEAMACGTPVIASNTSSLPEVVNMEDARFDPTSPKDICDKIIHALIDPEFGKALRQMARQQSETFTWDNTARLALKAVEEGFKVQQTEVRPARLETLHDTARTKFLNKLALLPAHLTPADEVIAELASILEANTALAQRTSATSPFSPKLNWRIEGPFDSTYSLAILNRESARALDELQHNVILHSTEGPGDFAAKPAFLKANPDIASFHAREPDFPAAISNVASRNLYPPRVADMVAPVNMLHHYAWEESGYPFDWITNFNAHLEGITCLSTHVEKVLIDNGLNLPTVTSGCGVDHWQSVEANANYVLKAKGFRFLHVSSCFPRKGVEALLDAYGKCFKQSDDVELIIKTFRNPHNEVQKWLADRRRDSKEYPTVKIIEMDLSDSDLKALYQQCHVLVAPSYAEGFGLPMAEAILSGLPVITTNWGGQLDFLTPSVAWLVDYTFEHTNTHFEIISSAWAAVDVDDLAVNLMRAFRSSEEERQARVERGRKILLENFTWRDATARMVNAARKLEKIKDVPVETPRIGWVTTWNTKCGIATYSKHLASEMTLPFHVFAPFNKDLLQDDEAFVVRCWNTGNSNNHFDDLAKQIEDKNIDVLIIQFNNTFFNFRDLNGFIEKQKRAGRTIFLSLHSTADTAERPDLKLEVLSSGLRAVDRILVHTVKDLNNLKALGHISNVALFPHGVVDRSTSQVPVYNDVPVVASYGFCLPHKGLLELVRATDILRSRGRRIKLKLINAVYPLPLSQAFAESLKSLIIKLRLDEDVLIENRFLSDEESLAHLERADLIIYPYQKTNESASGAAKYGLIARRPVLVSPLQIFDDLGGAVFRSRGVTPEQIADSIIDTLNAISEQRPNAQKVASDAQKWIKEHSFRRLGLRLTNMAKKLFTENGRYYVAYYATSPEVHYKDAVACRHEISNIVGREGIFMYGPYMDVPAGTYKIRIYGQIRVLGATPACIDITSNVGQNPHLREPLQDMPGGICCETILHLDEDAKSLEIRFTSGPQSDVSIRMVEITRAGARLEAKTEYAVAIDDSLVHAF
jgi:glycosyltransferase involved in cell wall biosynthesis